VSLQDFQEYLGPIVLKQLMNPVAYATAMDRGFNSEIDRIEPPEPDHDEPEREPRERY